VDGKVGSGRIDVVGVPQQFGGVRAIELNEMIALEANRMRDRLMDNGKRLSARDLLIAASGRSIGDELVVANADFETGYPSKVMDVTNLRRDG
jgi:hypothetical protein